MVQSIILTGPTAVGKSSLAIEVAKLMNLEIINADSVCFYREFNIGSAKPSATELEQVKHHLIDVANPTDTYHAGAFLKDLRKALDDIHARGKRALITGGSGFYLKAMRMGLWDAPETSPEFRASIELKPTSDLHEELKRVDPNHAEKISVSDRYRIIRALEIIHVSGKKPSELQAEMGTEPNPEFALWVVDRDPAELATRMRARIHEMLEMGFVAETEELRKKYPDSKTLNAVGYAQVLQFLDGITPEGRKLKPGLQGLADEIELSHRQLAKSQRTWFKSLNPEKRFTLETDRSSLIEKLIRFYQ